MEFHKKPHRSLFHAHMSSIRSTGKINRRLILCFVYQLAERFKIYFFISINAP